MPGYLLDVSSAVFCAHMPGKAQPTVPNPRVKVSGNQIVAQSTAYTIAGCALSPATTASWRPAPASPRSSAANASAKLWKPRGS